jgi:hypothetical protein
VSFIYSLRDSNRFVYHYTSAKTALNFILANRTLWLTHFSGTNDPKESKQWRMILYTERPGNDEALLDSTVPQDVAERLKSPVHLSCFCRDMLGLTGDHTRDILKRGLARARMWAQYAEKHTGFCLVFDRELLVKKVRDQLPSYDIVCGDVSYIDRSWLFHAAPHGFRIDYDHLVRVGVDAYCSIHARRYLNELYFEKLSDWRDENEWRIVALGRRQNFLEINIEDSLIGVVHGDRTSVEDSERALALAPELSITHTSLQWQNHCPWYDLGNRLWNWR